MSATPRSTRLPWMRTGLMGLVLPLLPVVWVTEVSSCVGTVTPDAPMTGLVVLGKFDLDAALIIGTVLLLALATPWLANRLTARLGLRVVVQGVGLAATALSAYGASFAMFFTLFSTRELAPAGAVVLGLFGLCVLEAVARVGFSAQEWWRSRRPAASP